MYKLALLPAVWGGLGSVALNEDTGISLGLFLAGIGATVALVWWARGDRDKVLKRICRLEEWRDKVNGAKTKQETEAEKDRG